MSVVRQRRVKTETMKQLSYRHKGHDPIPGCHGGGSLEVIVGPYSDQEARRTRLVHRASDNRLGLHAPKSCRADLQPYDGTRSFIPVCSRACEQCASGEHNEVRDAA